jgi:predicted secreted protein
VTGLRSSGLVLTNGTDTLAVAPNPNDPAAPVRFVFAQKLIQGAPYTVAIKWQPTLPSQVCTLKNGIGTTALLDVTNLEVRCETVAYPVTVNIIGLRGEGLVLENNGGSRTIVSRGATKVTFLKPVPSGETFNVTIENQPTMPKQICRVRGESGTIVAGEVTSVTVNCTDYRTIGGTVSGLEGNRVELVNVDGSGAFINTNGRFTMTGTYAPGTFYEVKVMVGPDYPIQDCIVTSGSGVVSDDDVTDISVVCRTRFLKVGIVSYGLTGQGLRVRPSTETGDFGINPPGVTAFGNVRSRTWLSLTIVQQPENQPPCYASSSVEVIDRDLLLPGEGLVIDCPRTAIVGGEVRGLRGMGLVIATQANELIPINVDSTFSSIQGVGVRYEFRVATTKQSHTILRCDEQHGLCTLHG